MARSNVSETHSEHLARFGVPVELLKAAGVRSVSDANAREHLGLNGFEKDRDVSGILFPYFDPKSGNRVGARVRLDTPIPDGAKYLMEPGCRHLFFAPGAGELLADLGVPVVLVESEKAALSIVALAERSGRKYLAIATGGCWGWKRTIGKRALPDGGTEPQTGPSPDFELVAWTGRDALVTFDANVKTNAKVRWAREAFRTELARRGASVSYVEIPPEDGTNGPDDFLAKHDDEAMLALLDGARRATEFDIPGRVPITEQSNAERLYAKYPDDFRYASDRGVWLAWNGRSWAVGDTCAVLRATSRVARDIYFEAANEPDEVRRKSLWKWAKDSESRRVQENAASLARSLGGFECAYAEIFDREPHLFNAANCTIDLRTGEPHPHRREDFLTKVAPIAYDADAECPKFSKFVAETFPARGLADYVSCVMGYFLGGVTSEQIWWLFHGGTATGKSTFVKILHGLLGPYAFALPENFFLISKGATDFTTAHLAGVRLATCSETSEGKRLDVAKLKMLTGEDAVTAALKYENQFTFRMEAKLVLVTNHAPRVPAGDDAIWRRIRVVPFRRPPVSDEARVADLAARLLETEGPGILRFAVRGSVERYRVGLAEPEVVKVAVRDYRADEDVIQHFLDDACVTDPATRVARKALYSAYARWSTENGLHAVSAKKLANELQRLGIDGDLGDRFWLGVRFKDSSTQEA